MINMDTNRRPLCEASADKDVLAMAFINVQHINSVYDAETGFVNGTIFPCLDKPFIAGRRMPR